MQLHSTAMNGKSAAHRDAIPALILMFFHGYKGRRWTCSPYPFLQQNGRHGILRKSAKPNVTLFHACAIFFLILSKV